MREFRVPLRGVNEVFALWDVRQNLLIVTDVSGRLIGPTFKSQAGQKDSSWAAWPLKLRPTACPETSVTTNHRCVASQKMENLKFVSPVNMLTFKGESNIIIHALYFAVKLLTLILLTWRIWRAPNNASKWRMRFNWVFKALALFIPMKVMFNVGFILRRESNFLRSLLNSEVRHVRCVTQNHKWGRSTVKTTVLFSISHMWYREQFISIYVVLDLICYCYDFVNEISSSVTDTLYIVWLLYNKKEYNLMMTDIEAETCTRGIQ